MRKKLIEYIWITIGVLILSFGLLWFLFPSNLAVGGLTGFVMVINHYFPMVPRGILLLIFNVVLLVLGFILIGKEFGAKTVYSSFALSAVITIVEKFLPVTKPIVDDVFLNLCRENKNQRFCYSSKAQRNKNQKTFLNLAIIFSHFV